MSIHHPKSTRFGVSKKTFSFWSQECWITPNDSRTGIYFPSSVLRYFTLHFEIRLLFIQIHHPRQTNGCSKNGSCTGSIDLKSLYCISTASQNRNSASWVKYKSAVLFILIKLWFGIVKRLCGQHGLSINEKAKSDLILFSSSCRRNKCRDERLHLLDEEQLSD